MNRLNKDELKAMSIDKLTQLKAEVERLQKEGYTGALLFVRGDSQPHLERIFGITYRRCYEIP